jgi:putative transposase
MKTTMHMRLYPTSAQAAILRAHCQEYISTINELVAALDSDVLPDGGKGVSSKDFTSTLPSAVKNQTLRDARSIWNRSFALGVLPVLRKPICQWNNQNWCLEGDRLSIPVWQDGKVQQISLRCAAVALDAMLGTPGLLRINRKRGKWIAEVAYTLPAPEPTTGEGIMGIDLGIKVPAVVHIIGKGNRFFGTGRMQRAKRRQFYARRKVLQHAKKVRAIRTSQGKEARWMRDTNHKLSHQVVSHAHEQGVGIIRMEHLAGIGQRTARTSRGAPGRTAAKARQNNRMMASWTFQQLATSSPTKRSEQGSWWKGWTPPIPASRPGVSPPQPGRCPPPGVCGVWLGRTPGRRRRHQHQSQDSGTWDWPAW